MKEENPDSYYKPLLIAITWGTRSGKPHFRVEQDVSHSHTHTERWQSCPPSLQHPDLVLVSCTGVSFTHCKHLSQTVKPKYELPCCWRSREVKTSHEYAGNRKQTHTQKSPARKDKPILTSNSVTRK